MYEIRRANKRDIFHIIAVLHAAHKQNKRRGFYFPASTISSQRLQYLMKQHRYFVLQANKVIIGVVAIKKRKKFWEIGSLAVIPRYQKSGWGGKLLRFAETRLKQQGIYSAFLTTQTLHPVLPRYYYSKGYRRVKQFTVKHTKWTIFRKSLH
ncbi:GNAT family N-acetyltransferase [Paenibacillus sedimenti]|uniref:GNAT family N-acetyltransferase n=1 Tax=Paenibacillus sedimenti TaxID=2770274 RepID=A0A926QM98_9BACL|nr:GNAT family N-acetyltransferase [Paenibacillus sedimenti]MBD0384445.1 GNAT family N-acetyltransferase [Paenibacillus sedimenti]